MIIPSGYVKIAIENDHKKFFVGLPEGSRFFSGKIITPNLSTGMWKEVVF